MKENHKTVIAYLTIADTFLRKAMVLAGECNMLGVTNDIRDAEWYLDEALARTESAGKNNSRKGLTKSKKGV